LLLITISVLPALGIILYSGLEQRNREMLSARQDLLLLTQSLAAQQEQMTAGIRQTLITLAHLPEIKSLDAKACNTLFRDIHRQNPFYVYANIGATTPEGDVFASSTPFTPGINVADRKQIRDAIRTRAFSAGEYGMGRVSGVPSFTFAYPAFDDNDRLIAIMVIGFKLDSYGRFLSQANLPPGSVLGMADHQNITLYRYPETKQLPPGTPIPPEISKRIPLSSKEGVVELTGRDSVCRIYAHKRLWLRSGESPYLTMYLGTPKSIVTRQTDRTLIRNLILLGLAAFLAMALAWIFGGIMIVKPLNTLADRTQRLGGCQADVRTRLPHTRDEMGQLAKSFDGMVIALEKTDAERKKAEEEREALILELNDALANIKTLKGLLPICASCKKIRNDEGFWEQMEMYIRDRSDAEFSHGICPECMKKLYPDYVPKE
jgi:HAMP domain-containing protein